MGIALQACPHCGAATGRVRRVALGLVGLAGGSAVSMTLMACYGVACVDDGKGGCADFPDDAGHTLADARVNDVDAGDGGTSDADASDAAHDAAFDAPSDGPSDAPHDAPEGG